MTLRGDMIDKETKLKARTMYLSGQSPQDIADELQISINTVRYWVDKGSKYEAPWKEVKKEESDTELLKLLEKKTASLDDIFSLGINALRRGLAHIELNKVVLETSAMSQLVTILDKVDRWKDLEAARNEKESGMTLEESEDAIKNHPFYTEES